MTIELNGYGYYIINSDKFSEFISILNIDTDLFLDMMIISKSLIPIISINTKFIDQEGPIKNSKNITEIGTERLDKLLFRKIIYLDPNQ